MTCNRAARIRRTAIFTAVTLVSAGCTTAAETSTASDASSSTAAEHSPSVPASTTQSASTVQPMEGAVQAQPVDVPSPPLLEPLAADDAVAATDAAAIFESPNPGRAAVLAAAIARVGVPVVDIDTGTVVAGPADGVGIPWTFVWAIGDGPAASRLRLDDVARMFALDVDADQAPELGDLGTALLNDVRMAATSDRPEARFLGLLVQASAARRGVDVLDPATASADVYVDMPTVMVMYASLWRVAAASEDLSDGVDLPSILRAPAGGFVARRASAGCASDDFGQWFTYVTSKILGGITIGGFDWPGFYGTLGAAGAAWLGRLTGVMSVVAALAQMSALKATNWSPPKPLVRTKSTSSEGEEGDAKITIAYDYGSEADNDTTAGLNCLALITVSIGNNSFIPPAGPVAGTKVYFTTGKGFNDFVYYRRSLKTTTDSAGVATLTLTGKRQREKVSDNAKEKIKTYSLGVGAKPDADSASSMTRTLINQAICVSSVGIACTDAVIDFLKATYWDLGQFEGEVKDWAKSYRVEQTLISGDGTELLLEGKICDLKSGFAIKTSASASGGLYEGALGFEVPSGSTGVVSEIATVTYDGASGSISRNGSYTIDDIESPTALTITITSSTVTVMGVTRSDGNSGTYEIPLIEDPSACG
jgi:hypothetical protein